VCFRHGWQFDVLDGRPIYGDAPLREYPNRVDQRAVLAQW
jgi:hypothetical protein